MAWLRQHGIFIAVLLFVVAVNALYLFVPPEEIVGAVGVTNSYVVAFLIAAIGGVSSLTGVAFYSTLATFGAGGSNPLLLALIGGVGIFISDSIFFFLAYHGHKSIPERWRRAVDRAFSWVRTHPRRLVLILSYFYLGFVPLPSDLLMLVLVLAGYRYREVAPVLLAAGVTLAFIAASVGYGWL